MRLIKRVFFSIVFSAVFVTFANILTYAAPIENYEMSLLQPDGTTLNCY